MMRGRLCRYAALAFFAFSLSVAMGSTAQADGKIDDGHKTEKKKQARVIIDPAPLCGEGELQTGVIKVPINKYRSRNKVSDRIPDIILRTHEDKPVRFFSDLVKDRIVLINFMYTECTSACIFNTSNLMEIHRLLGKRMGREIMILSISLDPKTDTPKVLKEYFNKFSGGKEKKGWLFLTGDCEEIDQLRLTLGYYDPDPIIDAQRDSHAGLLTFGNDITNRWASLPIEMNTREIATTVLFITRRKGSNRF